MVHGIVFLAETASVQQGHRQRIAERQRRRGTRGRRKVQWARFLGDRRIQMHRCRFRQGGCRFAGNRDNWRAAALQLREDFENLVGFPGIGYRDHHIARRDHAQVAMTGLTGMHEECRCSG